MVQFLHVIDKRVIALLFYDPDDFPDIAILHGYREFGLLGVDPG